MSFVSSALLPGMRHRARRTRDLCGMPFENGGCCEDGSWTHGGMGCVVDSRLVAGLAGVLLCRRVLEPHAFFVSW